MRPLNTAVAPTLPALPIAQLSGLPVFRLDWPGERLPGVIARRAVQRAHAPTHTEHLIVYVANAGRQLAFTWTRWASRVGRPGRGARRTALASLRSRFARPHHP